MVGAREKERHVLADNMDRIIQLAIGVFGTLIGYGKLTIISDPEKNGKFMQRAARPLKIIGPILVVVSLALMFL